MNLFAGFPMGLIIPLKSYEQHDKMSHLLHTLDYILAKVQIPSSFNSNVSKY